MKAYTIISLLLIFTVFQSCNGETTLVGSWQQSNFKAEKISITSDEIIIEERPSLKLRYKVLKSIKGGVLLKIYTPNGKGIKHKVVFHNSNFITITNIEDKSVKPNSYKRSSW